MFLQRGSGVAGCWILWSLALSLAGCGGSSGTGSGRDGGGEGGRLDGGVLLDSAPLPDVAPPETPPPVDTAPPEAPVDMRLPAGAITVAPIMGLKTTERGGQALFTVVLKAPPTADVTIALASSKVEEGTITPKTLTFTAVNWNGPQTVTITGVDDQVADGDAEYKITLAPADSDDTRYDGLDGDDVMVINTDDETAGLTVAPRLGLTTTEMGGQAMFTVALNSKPTATVTVPVLSLTVAEGVAAPAMLTFTPDNWNAPQTVTVTGADDQVADGTQSYKVKVGPPTGTDPKYAALMAIEVDLSNTDNETAGVTVTPPVTPTTTEAGGTATFMVVLNTKPTANVMIPLSSNDLTEGTVAPAMLTFTATNWNAPQMVTVTGVDDALADGNQLYTIVTGDSFSVDLKYQELMVADVVMSNVDNDSSGVTVTAPTNATTSEAGRQVTFSVVLNSQPTANVVIPVSSSDTTEGTITATSLTFTPGNWNAPQPVTVTGVDDALADGNQLYSILTAAATSTDTKYAGVDANDVSVTNTDNDSAGVTLIADNFLTTTEAGGTATFTIVLNSQPTGNVVIPLSSNDTTEGTVPVTMVVFTPMNWNAPQTITVTGVNDALADGNQVYSVVTAPAQSADNGYHNIDPANVLVFNTDNDSAAVTVTAATLLTTTEAGGTAMFTVVLNSQPTANVTVGVQSSDATEGTASPATLTFTSSNWSTAQTVTVTGVNDAIADGPQPYTILTGFAVSTDASYNGVDVADVAASNTDNDSASITVTAAMGLTTTEAGGQASFTVVLNSEPTANVTIGLTSSDTTEGTVAPASLTFTAANWSTAQTVTVTGVNDALDDGNQTYSIITAAAASSDTAYSGVNPTDVSLSNTDNDSVGITVMAAAGLTVAEGGTASFTVVLNSEPTANVTVALTSSDTTEGTVPASVTFTPGTWNTAQTVTITGVEDAIDDNNVSFTITTAAATSTDTLYNGVDPANVSVTNIDNDMAGVTVTPTAGLTVTEAAGGGNTTSFTVVLTSEPTANVVVGITSSDLTEGTVSTASLTFTSGNWNVAQPVTITGVDETVDDNDVTFTVVTAAATSTDPLYGSLNPGDVSVSNIDNDAAGITVTPTSGLTVTEAAGGSHTATFTVVLTSQPTADVTIGITSSDTTEGTVAPASLTFTSVNWSTTQTVTITGVDESIDDNDVLFSIVTAAATSADAGYNGRAASDVSVTTTDNDGAAITVTPVMGLTVTEAAGMTNTTTFTVVLTSQPTADVVVTLSSSDTTEGTMLPGSLTFTAMNWSVAQTVTITGVNDSIDDGPVMFSIVTAAAVSADTVYNGMNASDVSVTNTDDDTASITVNPTSGLTVTEAAGGGNTTTFTVVLTSEPTADLVIPLFSSDLTEGTVSPGSLTFTSSNWNVAQTVTITGVDDAADDMDVAFTITTDPALGPGSGYAGMNAANVSVTNTDDD